ncbi:unnamed protein product, partial [Brenthis ino]
MLSWLTRGASSSSPDSAERNPLVLPFRVPRSYGSVFPYYRFMRDALGEVLPNEEKVTNNFGGERFDSSAATTSYYTFRHNVSGLRAKCCLQSEPSIAPPPRLSSGFR